MIFTSMPSRCGMPFADVHGAPDETPGTEDNDEPEDNAGGGSFASDVFLAFGPSDLLLVNLVVGLSGTSAATASDLRFFALRVCWDTERPGQRAVTWRDATGDKTCAPLVSTGSSLVVGWPGFRPSTFTTQRVPTRLHW